VICFLRLCVFAVIFKIYQSDKCKFAESAYSLLMQIPLILFIGFLSIAGAYYLLIMLVFFGLLKNRNSEIQEETYHTKVTVIIPAKNEETNILHLLNDLLQQTFPFRLLEVILVDDGSTDKTNIMANNFAADNPGFPFLILKIESDNNFSGSKKRAIKSALLQSSGELILATDADTRIGKNWITSMVSYYEKFHPIMILGPVVYSQENSFFARIQSCEFMGLMAVTEGSCALHRPLMCNGANIAYSRKAFDMVGGFDDNFRIPSGDDMFLMMKIRKRFGWKAVRFNRSEEAIVVTSPNATMHEFIQQRLRWVSKNKGYKDFFVLFVATLTYLFNVSLLLGLIVGFFIPSVWVLTLILLGGKIVVEFPVLWNYAIFLGRTKDLIVVPVVQFLNIFYVSIIGLLGNFLTYEWKGKKVNPTGKS